MSGDSVQVQVQFLSAPGHAGSGGEKIAYKKTGGRGPDFIWCGGLKSDMEGSKALALHDWALANNRAFVRFDYFGHGQSSGRFRDGTMTRWARDIVQVMDELCGDDVILCGSSMGGWASLLAMLQRSGRVRAMLLMAPAPDFTERLMWDNFSEEARRNVMEDGIHYEPSEYDEPYEYSRELIEDGRENLLLGGPIPFTGPVRILQGLADDVVPWGYPKTLVDMLTSDDVTLTLVKDGDHSLSREADLARLIKTAEVLAAKIAAES